MTKLAANLTMLFTEVPFLERYKKAHQAGFKAVEFLFPYQYELLELTEKLTENNLKQALFNMPPGDWENGERGLASLPGRESEFEASIEKTITYANAFDCKKVHAMSGVMDPKYSKSQHIDTFIKNIRLAADHFSKHNIELMIEPLNNIDVPNYFISSQYDAVELIKEIKKDNVKLQLDIYHAQIMDGDLTRLIKKLSSFIGHVQIASIPSRNEPNLEEINLTHIFDILNKVGYDDWIGCEYNPKTTTENGLDWASDYL